MRIHLVACAYVLFFASQLSLSRGEMACLLLATALGLPVSTTHTRTAALLGVGSAGGRRADWGVAWSIALAWLCTFPGCMGLGWLLAKGMLEI